MMLVSGLLVAGTANAKDAFDGSSDFICAAIDVVGCVDADQCTKGQARVFDLPEFMDVDFKKNVIHATYDGGDNEVESPINHHVVSDGQLVLQGFENGHGWSMSVNQKTGHMSIASVGADLSYMIFGACKIN
jgi:hypothetical protein